MKAKIRTKKTKFLKHLPAMIAIVLTIGITMATAIPTWAANTPVHGGSTKFKKYLVMDTNANVPNAIFDFTISSGEAVEATGQTPAIYSGLGTPTIGSAIFSPDNSTIPGTPANPSDSKQKYATQDVSIDFSNVVFSAPGIYRYIVTETPSTYSGITNDKTTTRTLDVYVGYKEGSETELQVTNYVLHEGLENPNSAIKSNGFTNTYTTNNLTLTKNVTGNQGNRDKYFEFTVNITDAVAGTVYTVDLPDTDNDEKNKSTITVGETGTVEAKYYLKDNQSIVIQGLTAATKYKITETNYNNDGYTTTYTLDSESAVTGNTFDVKTMGNASHTVIFTNTKDGVVPTGILFETAPYLILGVVVIVGAIALFGTRRRYTN